MLLVAVLLLPTVLAAIVLLAIVVVVATLLAVLVLLVSFVSFPRWEEGPLVAEQLVAKEKHDSSDRAADEQALLVVSQRHVRPPS
jgi:hypothetical protein